jgi:hypothetical protein
MSENRFVELAGVNVNEHVEKKAGLTYLSWAWALDQLLRRDPDATWEFGQPILCAKNTMMVVCTVTAFGKSRTMHLPVMDNRNKPIADPDAFAINTAMMRCLVKCIATHGLGLYIYAGEDLPPGEEAEEENKPTPLPRAHPAGGANTEAFEALPEDAKQVVREHAMEVIALFDKKDGAAALSFLTEHYCIHEDKMALWSQLPSQVRAWLKTINQPQKEAA